MNPGERVYSLDGREFIYVGAAGQFGHVASPLFENGYGDEVTGAPEIVDQLFDKPPAQKLDADVARLESECNRLREQRDRLGDVIAGMERERLSILDRLKRHEALTNLDALLEGKMTHLVVLNRYSGAPEIVEIGKARAQDSDRWNEKQRLLVLRFNKTGVTVEWGLSQYSDGSGDAQRCISCPSLDEALRVAACELEAAYEALRLKPEGYRAVAMRDAAVALRLAVPDDVASMAKKYQRDRAQSDVTDLQKRLATAQAVMEQYS